MTGASSFEAGKSIALAGLLSFAMATFAGGCTSAAAPGKFSDGKSNAVTTASVAGAGSYASAPAQLYNGNAPYICTPSGFGKLARCFLRGSVTAHR